MPSRKRAKGKERKLKNQAQEPIVRKFSHPHVTNDDNDDDDWGDMSLWEQLIRLMERAKCDGCTHGCEIPPKDHPVYKFMNTIDDVCSDPDDERNVLDAVEETFKNHHEVWKDAEMRKMTIKLLVSYGTNCILINNTIEFVRYLTFTTTFLEHYTGDDNFSSIIHQHRTYLGYIVEAGDNDVIRFYYKRIPCSCLKQKYSAIRKGQDRASKCFGCNQTTNRKNLFVCGDCEFAHYCSKQCQRSHWPTHKTFCKKGIREARQASCALTNSNGAVTKKLSMFAPCTDKNFRGRKTNDTYFLLSMIFLMILLWCYWDNNMSLEPFLFYLPQ